MSFGPEVTSCLFEAGVTDQRYELETDRADPGTGPAGRCDPVQWVGAASRYPVHDQGATERRRDGRKPAQGEVASHRGVASRRCMPARPPPGRGKLPRRRGYGYSPDSPSFARATRRSSIGSRWATCGRRGCSWLSAAGTNWSRFGTAVSDGPLERLQATVSRMRKRRPSPSL